MNSNLGDALLSSGKQEELKEQGLGKVIIIGAGPVGLALALNLRKITNEEINVYEGREEIPNNPEESYPIGINPRSLNCLRLINPELEERAIQNGKKINSWQIFGGTRKVAELGAGTVYGTTRSGVNLLLYDEAVKLKINIHFGHKLSKVDIDNRTLTFETSDKLELIVDGKNSRVFACDGVYSKVRRELVSKNLPDFTVQQEVWRSEHRVLFAPPGLQPPTLDESVHYIYNGCYTAVIKRNDGQDQWSLCTGAFDHHPAKLRKMLLSKDPSDENVKELRKFLLENAPSTSCLFGDDELRRYFTRKTYRGAIITCNKMNIGEWILLLGDAAHSVLPPTGEGINSGLEDTVVFSETLKNTQDYSTLFSKFNSIRHPQVLGLGKIAKYLNENFSVNTAEKASRITYLILQTISKKSGLIKYTYEDHTFGALCDQRTPYDQIAKLWEGQKNVMLPISRVFMYPIVGLCYLITSPYWVPKMIYQKLTRDEENEKVENSLKPPIDLKN